MGFDTRDNAKSYIPQEGDTLQAIAERETAAGNPLSWQDLARFNWGTDDQDEINAFLRDELGARKRDADNNFVLSTDDEPPGELLIPMPFEKRALALERTYVLRVRKKVAPPQFLECCHLPGVTFAERETAAGNPLSWQDLARFNWGTDDQDEINAFLRDELGARKRDADNNFVLSTDDEPPGELLIPMPFEKRALALERTYVLRVRKKVAPPQFLECCHLPGVTFAFGSSFIRPNVVGYLKKLEAVAGRHPEAQIMIFGHTDAVGDDLYNKKLSERRAWSVYAFITNDPDVWEVLYNHSDEAWGLAVIQEILADLGHDPGAPDGDWGPQTRAAMRSFLGLPEDASVQNDAAFRQQLFAAYMNSKHDVDLPPERFMDPGYMGCSEFNPVAETAGETEQNRRVTVFFFHPDRLPKLPCAFADVGPCKKQTVSLEQRHTRSFRCSFYDSLAKNCANPVVPGVHWISFRLLSKEDDQPVRDAKYSLELPDGRVIEGHLDGDGFAKIDNTPPGICTLRFYEYHAADWEAAEDGDFPQPEDDEEATEEEEEEVNVDPIDADGENPFLDDDPDDDDEIDDEDVEEA